MTETETPIIDATTPAPTGRYSPQDVSGSFASGEEQMPEKDAQERVHAVGSFASGEEQMPEKDAEERVHPGTFADTTEAHA
jgi:hypothetical protein